VSDGKFSTRDIQKMAAYRLLGKALGIKVGEFVPRWNSGTALANVEWE
jgi:hypothetical protein